MSAPGTPVFGQQALDHLGQEIVGPDPGEGALAREMEGRAHIAGDDGVPHDEASSCRSCFLSILPTAVLGS